MVWRVYTLLVAVGVLVAGCSSPPDPGLTPKGHIVIPAHPDASRVRMTVHVQDEVVIQLPPLTTPHTQWTIVFNDERYLKQLRPLAPVTSGGFETSFLAMRTGRRPVRWFALPPAGREAVPTQSYEVYLTIE